MENANGVIKKLTSAERSYYTAAEVREMMGVSRDTAYRMIRSLRSDLIADGQLTPYATADAGIISMVLRNLADDIEKNNPGAKELRMWAENNTVKPELKETIKIKKPNLK